MIILNLKLWRDLLHLKAQVLAIAIIIGAGSGLLIMSLSVHEALRDTTDAYYERYRFADVFAGLNRAPTAIAEKIMAIDGVETVQTRVSSITTLQIPGLNEPVQGMLVSLPQYGESKLNRLFMRSGRMPDPAHIDEVVVSEQFADAHNFVPGDQFFSVMNGNRRKLTIVGTALSPEFIYAMAPGALMPDDKRFGILWVREDLLAAAFDLDGAFNDLTLALSRSADSVAIIDQLDDLLARYGGVGAIERKDQLSNWFVMNEIDQINNLAVILPTIFLLVSAFLTNMVTTRLISVERGEIGLLKANGYSNAQVAWHYLKLTGVIAFVGLLLGSIIGLSLGKYAAQLYTKTYHFPFLLFRPHAWIFATGILVSLAATWLGTLNAVYNVVRMPPAEAMQPPQPPRFRRSWFAGNKIYQSLDQATRIVIRRIARGPLRAAASIIGMSAGLAVMIMALQWIDAIETMVDVDFSDAQHQDFTVTMAEPRTQGAIFDFAHLPGVLDVQPSRHVAADFSNGLRGHRGGIVGVDRDARLQTLHDVQTGPRAIPQGGVVLGDLLAKKLMVSVGDEIKISVLSGRRPVRQIRVTGIVETYLGMPAYMEQNALNRLMNDGPVMDTAHLRVDPSMSAELLDELRQIPIIASVTSRIAAINMFHETIDESIFIFVGFYVGFALLLSFGVSYNSARIALSENGRDLATLRVLGFTRGEIAYICLAETAILALAALPLGSLFGYWLANGMAVAFNTELFRIPVVITTTRLGQAAMVLITATVLSLMLVRRRLERLDLISVLKTRE